MELDFRLYNCDRTYSLDKVQALIAKVSPKAKVKQHYFPLPRMSELCNELNEEGTFSGYAVFVVHAHESRLSINEANAGIGYAKLYRTLLKITDGRVLIVIGGDNNYKGQDQDDAFLSQWAWRKICSQFTEDDMDGTKSFIFSWDEDHRPIHEEALEFYLDPNRKGKFIPKPKPKSKPAAVVPASTAGHKDTKADLYSSKYHHQYSPGQKPNPLEGKGTSAMGAHDDRASVKGPKPYSSQTSNQPPSLSQEQKSHPLDGRDHHAIGPSEQFPPEHNQGRPLPAAPKQSDSVRNDGAIMPLSSESLMDVDGPPSSKTVQKITFPIVHVVSVPSQVGDGILNNPVLNLIGDAFHTLKIPWGPHVPGIKPEDLPKHVQATSPDLVVLLYENADFMDVKEMNYQLELFRALLMNVKREESTKLIIVVTGDKSYKPGDLSSRNVENEVAYINKEILKHDKLKIMSWDSSPSPTHHDVIAGLLRETKSRQRKLTSKESILPEYDGQKGLLRCRAVIQDGRLLAILKSDPSDWKPSETMLADVMARHRERTKVEFWENSTGAISPIACISTAAPILRKIADICATKKIHSSQVYSYHSNENTFGVMDTFIKGLGVGAIIYNKPVELLPGLLHDIVVKKAELVVFSCDIEIAKNIKCADDFPLDYLSHATRAFEHLKGILIVLTDDESCRDGDLASDCALQILASINQMLVTVGFPSETEKISVMSWRDRPYIAHQTTLQHLLNRSQSSQQQHRSQNDRAGTKERPLAGTTAHPSPTQRQHATGTEPEFDPTKGFLRYRAELEHGQVVKVLARNPPDWHPDIRDIHFIAGKYMKVPNAELEFWADSLDGPNKGPNVRITKKSSWSLPSLPKMPSLF